GPGMLSVLLCTSSSYQTQTIGRLTTPGTNLVKAYKTSNPDLNRNCYWLYFDYYVHILGYENGFAHVRIGTEDCWISKDSLEEITIPTKSVTEANIYSEPSRAETIIRYVPANSDVTILDFNCDGFYRINYRGYIGYILEDALQYKWKQVDGANDGERAANLVKTKLGCKYVWAMSGPDTFDCSGLMQWAYNRLDIFMHRTADVQGNHGQLIEDAKDILPGDIITFHTDSEKPTAVTHVGMYVGNGQFIHASTNGYVVRYQDFNSYPYPVSSIRRYWTK
uniref:Clan CA, family C40, NlpC/P60 superfamily cysteine peptidase n=1 Tax=Trichomonas vaginalis TaxID=5722 RepID=UPI000F044F1E|nr:Chain A, Clan CA, family C40, NlpC/P60 superfamily cysteine peptidase [Trichomonas vaginalis]6BIQ_B Chain B, Clan CA, family C40, NlpC/P60 superfamily cysteine peptidase [Trichomonas vaginalis]6BIQ_C Chain C, Clan CA, family C40, NlpC/P60 superfamily cysteine peptidase [Trichomonas vaginalis]6BIQ_D Chain D, Clan CA, family C40, NlpC/P60 superfamily cysteine peptidase [Trichomonas vaginalis]